MSKAHAVIILASGLSQRLGQSKQLLSKDNQPLIGYMLRLALETQPKAIIIVIPKNIAEITTAIRKLVAQNPEINLVLNGKPEMGMAHSLYLAIEALNSHASINDNKVIDRVLIMGIDQVLLAVNHLHKLLLGERSVIASSYPNLDSDTEDFSVDESKAHIIGLPIAIDYALLKQWQLALTGDKGLRHLIRALQPEQMSAVFNKKLSYDIDTPEQFTYAKQQGWLDR